MSAQDFASLSAGDPSLLRQVETIVLEAHRGVHERDGLAWSPPAAYRWLRYEDPRPVERLREGVEKLLKLGARFDPEAVEKACREAAGRGFPN